MKIDKFDSRRAALVRAFKGGTLACPNIQCHEDMSTIDLSLQPQKLPPKIVAEGLSILPNLDLDTSSANDISRCSKIRDEVMRS